jgi:hypothetical protein
MSTLYPLIFIVIQVETVSDKSGEVLPVGFYSRKLTPPDEHYSTYDRELVGLGTVVYIFDINSWVFPSRYSRHGSRLPALVFLPFSS